jgi:hypothetical protein
LEYFLSKRRRKSFIEKVDLQRDNHIDEKGRDNFRITLKYHERQKSHKKVHVLKKEKQYKNAKKNAV